jgi:hypothetical protein
MFHVYNRINMKAILFFSLVLLLTTGCVGTVQEAGQNFSKVNDAPVKPLSFAGVVNVVAISDSRLEVFFYPATGGSGSYTYDIITSNSPYPVSIPSEVLRPDFRGLLKYTVTGLNRLTTLTVKVEVRDKDTEIQSNSNTIREVTTFDNMVADFNGVSSASNLPGQDGKDSIKIRWTPARSSGGLSKKDWDPKSYEIVVVDSEKLTPNDMDVSTYGPSQGRFVFGVNHDETLNEYVLRGLPSEKKFYIRMRAIHETSVEDLYNPKKRSELNTNYVMISTLSGNLADLKFQNDAFAVTLSPGEQGLNSVSTSWFSAEGVFDHYRLYYSEEGGGVANGILPDLCLSPLLTPPGQTVFCKKVDFKSTTSLITGLKAYTNYEFVLALCTTVQCSPLERILSPVRTIFTDPNTPTFNGLRDVITASKLEDLGSLYIKYDQPNFANGYFDGLILKARRTLNGADADTEVTVSSNPLYHLNYNFLFENNITVRGIDYLAVEPYCFTLYPFKWNTDGITRREYPNDIWKCITPKIEAPTVEQFKGLGAGFSIEDRITLQWEAPTIGTFSHYELFWRKESGGLFNWGDAISQAGNNFDYTNYNRLLLSPNLTTTVLSGFANGDYTFGLVTYFSYVTENGLVLLRSETNSAFRKCVVDDTKIEPINCL